MNSALVTRPDRWRTARAASLALLLTAHDAGAAGFSLIEYSAQGIGGGIAGGGAVAEDASAAWLNPASMVLLPSQVQLVAHVIVPTFDYTDRGSRQLLANGTAGPLLPTAPATASGGKGGVVPNLYVVRKLNERFTFGLTLNMPYGLATEYDSRWKGRYQTVKAEVIDINVNPAVGWRLNDHVSVGAGLSANYIDAEFTQAVDVAGACLGVAAPLGASASCRGFDAGSPTLGAGTGSNDGFLRQTADDLSFGYNLGVLLVLDERTRFSAAYRSQINHKLEGRADFDVPAAISAVAGIDAGIRATLADSGVSVGASLPDTLSFSVYHRLHPRFALLADVTWTGWSDVSELRFVYDDPATLQGSAAEQLRWNDTWRAGLGLHYYHDERLTLRAGVAYDPTPVPDASLRTPRLPDNDRSWVSVGASYRLADRTSLDVSYAHLFIEDTVISRRGSSGSVLDGVYESSVDMFAVQLNHVFD